MVHRRTTKILQGLKDKHDEDRQKEFGMFSPKGKKNRGDMIAIYIKGGYRKMAKNYFPCS